MNNSKLQKKKLTKRRSSVQSSVCNSSYATRAVSPHSFENSHYLQGKVSRLRFKLAQARSLIANYQRNQKEQRIAQEEFIKDFHLKVRSIEEEQFDWKEEEIEKKIINERNAIENIWKRRYEEMKKNYEDKINEMGKVLDKRLCSRCKAFIDNSNSIEEKLKSILKKNGYN